MRAHHRYTSMLLAVSKVLFGHLVCSHFACVPTTCTSMLLTVSKVLFGHLSAGWNPWGSAVSHACPPSVPPCFWRFRRCCLGTSSICSRLGEPSGWNPAGALPFPLGWNLAGAFRFARVPTTGASMLLAVSKVLFGQHICMVLLGFTRARHFLTQTVVGHTFPLGFLCLTRILPEAFVEASMGKRTCHDAISNTKLLATMPSGVDISSPNAAVSFRLAIRAFVLLPFGRPTPCLYWVFGACLLLRRWCHAAKGDLCADFRHHGLSPHLAPPVLQEKACSDRRSLAPLLLPTDVTHLRAVLVFFCSPAHVVPEVRLRQPLPACAARPATTHSTTTCLAYAPRRSACRPRSFSECRGIFAFVAYKTLFVRIARYARAIKCGLGPLALATVLRRRSPDGTLTALPRLTCVHVPLHAFLPNPSPVASFPLADAELRFTFRCVAFCARFFF